MTTPAKTTAPAAQPSSLALYKRDVVDAVANKVQQYISNGELNLPASYSPNNALKSAWLILQGTVDKEGKPAMQVCTRDSVANSLLDMIVQGLNPTKKQGYFIVYGKTLTFQRSYFGSMAVAQMVNPAISEFAYAVVYEGDTFKYGIKNGKKIIQEHEQELKNVDKKKIIAAYCIALDKNGNPLKTEIMTMDEIKQAWKQSKMNPIDEKGNVKEGSTHGKFLADMALKTVSNKCCKGIINASSDSHLLLERINRADDLADRASAEVEIAENANQGPVIPADISEEGQEAETVAETEAGINKHPAYDLCVEERGCTKYEAVSDCPQASNETLRNKCTHWQKPAGQEKTISGTVMCPDKNKVVARAGCPKCEMFYGCPVYDKGQAETGRMPGF